MVRLWFVYGSFMVRLWFVYGPSPVRSRSVPRLNLCFLQFRALLDPPILLVFCDSGPSLWHRIHRLMVPVGLAIILVAETINPFRQSPIRRPLSSLTFVVGTITAMWLGYLSLCPL
jgi:hypothetical protein